MWNMSDLFQGIWFIVVVLLKMERGELLQRCQNCLQSENSLIKVQEGQTAKRPVFSSVLSVREKKNVCPSCLWVTTFHLLLSFGPHLTDQEKRKTVHTSSLQEEEEQVLTMKSNTLKPIFSNTRHMCPWWLNQSSSTTHRLQQKNVKINYYIQNLTDLTHRLEQLSYIQNLAYLTDTVLKPSTKSDLISYSICNIKALAMLSTKICCFHGSNFHSLAHKATTFIFQ